MRYTLDRLVVDTERAAQVWHDRTDFDGRQRYSLATGSPWDRETLYLSARGVWYVEATSAWQGSRPHARRVTDRAAARWLLSQGYDLPDQLARYAELLG